MSPASPRSKDATGPSKLPFERFIQAAEAQGWILEENQPIALGRPTKPAQIRLRRGQVRLNWIFYGWYATLEGFARKKDDYRVQTTRALDDEPLLQRPGHQTVGVGWDTEREVFFGFDGWAERLKGKSTSVHVQRNTLVQAKADGFYVEGPRHDIRFGFRPDHVDNFITWVRSLSDTTARDAALAPEEIQISGDTALITADLWGKNACSWLRPGDRIVIVDKNGHVDDKSLWKIDTITVRRKKTAQQNAWRLLDFACRRTGRITGPLSNEILEQIS
jgi:hypothetical protein